MNITSFFSGLSFKPAVLNENVKLAVSILMAVQPDMIEDVH